MQRLSIVRNRNSSEWSLPLIGQIWHTRRFCVQRDISPSFMIICIRSFMTIMCFWQMRLRFWSQKKTEPMGTSITCGCIVPVRCMRTDRSCCTIISLRVMQAIQEISSRSSGGLRNRWLPGLSYPRKGTRKLENCQLLGTRKTSL